LDDPALDGLKKQILRSLGDRDVGDLAAYYASLQ